MNTNPASILIADDDLQGIEVLSILLRRQGHEVQWVADGRAAVAALRAGSFDLLLLDIMMPVMDGFQVLGLIHGDPDLRRVPVIVISAVDDLPSVARCIGMGAMDFLLKPFDHVLLAARIGACLEQKRMADAERQALEALKEAQSQLVQSEKLAGLGRMVAGVAHEINNPLAFVSNDLAVLQRDVGSIARVLALYRTAGPTIARLHPELMEQVNELCDRVDLPYTLENLPELFGRSLDGLHRIRQVVTDLRDFARLDEGGLREADLNAGIVSAAELVGAAAGKKRVRVTLHLAPLPPVVCCPAKVNQVVMNLLYNAVDASEEQGEVAVRSGADDGGVWVEVADAGCGMGPAVVEKVFDPFFTTKPVGQGRGLGLSTSYGIVKDHGGSIEVDSQPGQGSRFTVRLPLQPPALESEPAGPAATSGGPVAPCPI